MPQPGVLVLGTITRDFVDAPDVRLDDELGGSATYFALAARHFCPVLVVGVVGRDREAEVRRLLEFADLSRVTVSAEPTYAWHARRAMRDGEAETLERFDGASTGYVPGLSPGDRLPRLVFLGSIDPAVQLAALRAIDGGHLIAGDTMDIFISAQADAVERVAQRCDVLLLTIAELRMLVGGEHGLDQTAQEALERFGLEALVLKLGSGGAQLFTPEAAEHVPAYQVEVIDPTGAGDALAGGFLGRLAEDPNAGYLDALRWGVACASFVVEGIGTRALRRATRDSIAERLEVNPGKPGEP